ncbi:hypothetical protein AB835_05100 [Candidatus Endobugula sertula]|uniref:DNA-binding protein n=1 Tax=Candidatus Endobugula sertula TaxID=62101 RepID=A0A1D2QR98_9GAMM|nr:hypothetical protein AB835_05100 [Candidatus Endobugula sertula]
MVFKAHKRFIAGAVCPRCNKMDKLVTYKKNDKEFRECVSCDFHDEMHFKQHYRELETRVNTSEDPTEIETQVLVLDPNGNSTKH